MSASEPPRWARICEQEHSVTLDPHNLCTPLISGATSPIDNFYTYIESVVQLGKPPELDSNEALGKILLLGVVSATEHFFRAVLAGLVHVCPIVREQASSLQLSLGAIEYYQKADLSLALLEHVSLATAGEIRKQTERLLRIDVKREPSTDAALVEYEKLCQFRHAAAHARGDLGHQNLYALGLSPGSGRMALTVGFGAFQSAAAVCQNVARAYNRLLYRKTVEHWISEKVMRGGWNEDRERFSALFGLFYSRHDSLGPKSAYQNYRSLLHILRKAVLSIAEV